MWLQIAPFIGGVALLGEAGKVASVSAYRFVSVAAAGAKGMTVSLRGKPGEFVPLLFASSGGDDDAAGMKCTLVPVKIGADGTASAHFSG